MVYYGLAPLMVHSYQVEISSNIDLDPSSVSVSGGERAIHREVWCRCWLDSVSIRGVIQKWSLMAGNGG